MKRLLLSFANFGYVFGEVICEDAEVLSGLVFHVRHG